MTPRDWNEMKKLLGDRADQETLEAVKALVEGIETNLSGSLTANVVKSIQMGVVNIAYNATATVTISAVNPIKTMVLIGEGYNMVSLSSTDLIIKNKSGYANVEYQVVEFY